MKCKYWKKCEHYQEDSLTCNKNAGGYYHDGFGSRVPGCYIEMEKNNNKEKFDCFKVVQKLDLIAFGIGVVLISLLLELNYNKIKIGIVALVTILNLVVGWNIK